MPQIVVSPARLEFAYGDSPVLSVSTGAMSVPFSILLEIDGSIIGTFDTLPGITPDSRELFRSIRSLGYPGTYHGSVTITAPPGSDNSVVVPLTITVPPTPVSDPFEPKIAAVVDARSLQRNPLIVPGQAVSIFGLIPLIGTSIVADSKANQSYFGLRVLFNGVPAPLTYVSASRIEAVVPQAIAGSRNVNVEIDGGGVRSAPWEIALAPFVR